MALKMGVSWNKADILAQSPISKIGRCYSTSYLVSNIIRPELQSSKRIRNKNLFSFFPMQGWSDFAHVCKTPVLGDITNLWLNISPIQWRFNLLLCSSKENISHFFAIAQTRHFIDGWGVRRALKSKMIGCKYHYSAFCRCIECRYKQVWL